MTPERWQQIKSILEQARQLPRTGRPRWLEQACGGDRALLEEVDSFLVHEDELDGFIERPVLSFLAEEARDLDQLEAGRRVGPYRIVRLLGQGGMGAVYLAERRRDFEQLVALKLIHPSLAGRQMLRRFHDERQILARLEHPHIARLLDGGSSEEGAAYFAMELVEGEPIDAYCDRQRLSTRRRLELFLSVCSALQAAHQNLVIHRDLKPGNILVTQDGQPKLLDFGIAKQLLTTDGPGQEETLLSEQTMTLRYASPEQLKGEPIGTASDIYSLGVVLYRVLTGRLPGGLERLDRLDLMVAICRGDPASPSVVVGREEELPKTDGGVRRLAPQTVARLRGGDPKTLQRSLAGDVDSIVMKALRKEPHRRYASIEQLAADIRRYLDGLPVLARQGNTAYRAAKFLDRHRLGLAAVLAMVALAVGFTVALVRQLGETERARARSEEISAFLIDLFQAAAPDRPTGEEATVRDLLDRGRLQLEGSLEREPEVLATLRLKLGEVYAKLGDHDAARELLSGAIELLRRGHGGDHPDLATALNNLAFVHHSRGEMERAEELVRQSIAMRRRLGLPNDLLKPMGTLAAILLDRGELQEAQEIYREVLGQRRAALGEHHPNVALTLRSLATVLYAAGELDAAEPLLRQSLDICLEVYGPDSPKVATVLVSLGRLEHARGRHEEAEALYDRALRIRRSSLGDDHWHTALAKKDLAGLLLDLGEAETAGVLLNQTLATLYRVRPSSDRQIAEAEALLGVYFAATGRPDVAEICLLEALRVIERRLGPEAMDTRTLRRRLEDFYESTDRTVPD